MQRKVFQILVDNTSGVLSRISGLFSRRGYNIDSITAGVTADPKYTRITIVTSGDDEILDQIEKQVAKLEEKLADYVGVRHCITCANGTDALTIALMAWGIGEGDAVFVPDFTFFASGECPAGVGATPIFVDVDARTYNIDPSRMEERITENTVAVMPVHTFGQPCEMDAVMEIAEKHGLKVLEDCAEAHFATYKGRKVRTEVLRFEIVHPSEDVAVKLQMSTKDFVYDIIRVRILDDTPIVIEYTMMPIQLVPGIRNEVLEDSIYHYIEKTLGVQIQSAHRTVRAVRSTKMEQEHLHIPADLPILEVEQVAFFSDGHPFEYSISHHRSDKSEFSAISIR